ncbi:translocation protein SEC63 [Angomonas deanei]|uniref:DnaJ domain containing protein, putative n=1 Tax=Angomonas deanei TaxID=59799 RepID=A0A7G2CAS4_9TRYP|nr:translocation protein SEC63 [Angomonas deanei]CAD2216555.1 DnaJ domain containing protein, putative [Angomonas deanei]|eukprot:EPY39217.1 translocation protein SEC63 [Angomonas deanei]
MKVLLFLSSPFWRYTLHLICLYYSLLLVFFFFSVHPKKFNIKMAEGGVGGSDESFISFTFAVVSVILIVLYIPWIIGKLRSIYLYHTHPKKIQAMMVDPLEEIKESITFLPKVVVNVIRNPKTVVAGAKVCMEEKVFFFRCVVPKFLKFVARPRILVPLLWFVLFSSAMYISLTFDPHAVLGVSTSASMSEIKKKYRTLARQYHPDRNSTDEARQLFIQLRRAYKALVDPVAFEEEEQRNRHLFSVGVALPEFLTSRNHDALVLFGLLGVLIIIPFITWYKFTNNKKVPQLIWRIRFDAERTQRFFRHFGIPEDPKFAERRESRRIILRTLIQLGIVPPNVREDVVNIFPPLTDFVPRCLEVERNKALFQKLGFSQQHMEVLHAFMATNGVALVAEFDETQKRFAVEGANKLQLIAPSAYEATRYLFKQHTDQVDEAAIELQQALGGHLTSVKKLMNAHDEMYDLLDTLYRKGDGKPSNPIVEKLVAMPERISDIVDTVEPEVQLIYQRFYKQMLEQKGGCCGGAGGAPHGHDHGHDHGHQH